ncbi:hypothetical protein [Pedobacter sp. BMA]|uniref:hypothetical protein n=1 Tax=Pedobacter sp. BMA TaxID=1663685 RepID=UPI00064B7DAD|nr:hypothetical protein [Pedobacter sp. BMA]KLT66466.1 hypothetical protein AB669_04545 [Pedobacter sp. BMA]
MEYYELIKLQRLNPYVDRNQKITLTKLQKNIYYSFVVISFILYMGRLAYAPETITIEEAIFFLIVGFILIVGSVTWMFSRNNKKSQQWIIENGLTQDKLDAAERLMSNQNELLDMRYKIEYELLEEEKKEKYDTLKNQMRIERNSRTNAF